MMRKTISIIIILLILPFPLASALPELYIADVSCNLIEIYPYYDCSEILVILVYDVRYPPRYNATTDTFFAQIEGESKSLGFAYYNYPLPKDSLWDGIRQFANYLNVIIVGNTHDQPGIGLYDTDIMTPLMHEIKHIKCKCGWHPAPP